MQDKVQFQRVQKQLDDVLYNQPDRHLRVKEVDAILEGFKHYLVSRGYGGLEIPMIIANLQINEDLLW